MNEYDLPTMMTYENEKYFLGPYYAYGSNRSHSYSLCILDFKKRKPTAVEYFKRIIGQVVSQIEDELREDASFWYLVAMPPHTEGQRNDPCEDLSTALAGQFPWLQSLPGVLERTETVQKAAHAAQAGRPRPDLETHKQTIRYSGPQIRKTDYGILLIDDVFTNGHMFHACYDIISAATHCEHIKGLFLGKTVK